MKTKQLSSQFNLNKETIADLPDIQDLHKAIADALFPSAQESCRFQTYCC
ncbi:MAG: hypothetical protein GY757_09830 [bacterium]|nr:hypothetical protein [bacterium]